MTSRLIRVKATVAVLAAALSIRMYPRLLEERLLPATVRLMAPLVMVPLGEWSGRAERRASCD